MLKSTQPISKHGQGCKSLFEVGESILREGPYFIIFRGAYATFSPSWKILGGAIAPVAPRGCTHEHGTCLGPFSIKMTNVPVKEPTPRSDLVLTIFHN